MYTLIRMATTRAQLAVQALSLAGALVTAEAFYKFHSFTVECLAFLATWFVFEAVLSWLVKQLPAEKIMDGG